jgi:hypothetical protein
MGQFLLVGLLMGFNMLGRATHHISRPASGYDLTDPERPTSLRAGGERRG